MNKDKALKLALEALETCGDDEWVSDDDYGMMQVYDDKKVGVAITAIKEALAQPEQEPMAWLFQHEETGHTECVDTQQVEWGFEKNNPRWQKIAPLYTTPPQHKPLTNEERIEIMERLGITVAGPASDAVDALIKEVEAAHGIKEKNT